MLMHIQLEKPSCEELMGMFLGAFLFHLKILFQIKCNS